MLARYNNKLYILTMLLICCAALSGCADAKTTASGALGTGHKSSAAAEDIAAWDHISMEAAEDTSAEVLRQDADILEERLADFAGEGQYVLELSDTDGDNEDDRIDVYLDPLLKGKEELADTARIWVSGARRFSLYSADNGYLEVEEEQIVDLAPADLVLVERTDSGVKLQLSNEFCQENAEQLEAWQDTLVLIADIRDNTGERWLSGSSIQTWPLTPGDEENVWLVDPAFLADSMLDYLADTLQKEPLAGTYAIALQSGVTWNTEELQTMMRRYEASEEAAQEETAEDTAGDETDDSVENSSETSAEDPETPAESLLCSIEELEASGRELVTIGLRQDDRAMEEEERSRLLYVLCRRMDALGMPYSIGEMTGQQGTVAIRTYPEHITPEVLTILQGAHPLCLSANVYKTDLEGGRTAASVIHRPDGSLALSLSMTLAGKDALYRMSEAQEKLGGGSICLCMYDGTPLCGTSVTETIRDGALVFEKNYTGIGGTDWNADNRWLLDFICAVLNTDEYPQMENTEFLFSNTYKHVFVRPECSIEDTEGYMHTANLTGFEDTLLWEETLSAVRTFAPQAEITDGTDYADCSICLNLDPDEAEGEMGETCLAAVYQQILTSPLLCADVYLASDDTDFVSFRTFFVQENVNIANGFAISEDFYNRVVTRIYTGSPAMQLNDRAMRESILAALEAAHG